MGEPALSEDHLDLLLEKMYQHRGWDFRRYRRSSLRRCIARRIALSRLPHREYIELLDSQPSEFNNLFNHITIKVSEFFRDAEVFNQIERCVIPSTLERLRSEGRNVLRIWSCGCARGEESYSMAILLSKGGDTTGFNIKVFATDIDEHSIDIARKGVYGKDSLKNIPPLLRNQFFKPIKNSYQVIPSIRNPITFGVHDIVSNIHLSHMDIILCRNLLIYFEKDLQEKVFEKFCYSLNRGGFIILGKSEVVPSLYRNRFREVCKRTKIYQKV